MYGIFTYIYPKNQPNVGKYAIHGASGIVLGLVQSPAKRSAIPAKKRSANVGSKEPTDDGNTGPWYGICSSKNSSLFVFWVPQILKVGI